MKTSFKPDKYKDIIASSFEFLVNEKRIVVYGFVIPIAIGMSNHIHVIWQIQGGHQPKDVQLSFMKYTAQMIIKDLRNLHTAVLERFIVKASDRKYQIWDRNPLSIALWNQEVFKQKLDYILNNPLEAGLCNFPADYHYSSAAFYYQQKETWKFLTLYQA